MKKPECFTDRHERCRSTECSCDCHLKIKTPYGEKNWSFVKALFDNHQAVIEELEKYIEILRHTAGIFDDEIDRVQTLVSKFKGE